eukprot:Tamp_18320.p1 GENE.Tamp_18320~~Tamp_18320.p1  ORF type:complete len:191 (+),score=29.57 Tamp_18320:63-575(+)
MSATTSIMPSPSTGRIEVEDLDAGHRRACWLGWDGSIKEGIEGRQDFSDWLCPEVIAALEAGRAAEHLVPGTRIRAGYWSIAVPPAYSDPSEARGADDEMLLNYGGTVGVIQNSESSVKIVLTATGFIFQPEIQEPGDASVVGAGKCTAAGGLLLVSGGERPQRLPALAF